MRHWTWQFVIDWTSRMALNFGGTVFDREGYRWDWGQALMREMYGVDWMNSADYQKENNKSPEEPMDMKTIERAREWEGGDIPRMVEA